MADKSAAGRLRRWAVEDALPLWAGVGVDRANGLFHERLMLDGTPDLAAPRRLVVQARQIYVYAHAAVLGWYPQGTALALDAWESVRARYRAPDGKPGYVHILAADGSVADARRDTYGHAFLLLALAWLCRASGDAQVRAQVRADIDDVLGYFDAHLTSPDGTYFEGVPRTLPRRQNPHMHAYEAMLALHETIAHPQAAARALALRALLARFVDPASRTLAEFFDDSWRMRASAESVEPGHHAEWSWLLRKHERLAGLSPDPLGARFLDLARRSADRTTGLLPDQIDPDGSRSSGTFRCWPQTEYAKALLAAHETGAAGANAEAEQALIRLSERYLTHPVAGGWIDQIDRAGGPMVDRMPASTFYHVFCAITEADRVLGR